MSRNAFGGHTRLDKCDLQGPSLIDDQILDVLQVQGERTLWAKIVLDAVNCYLMWGLGRKNGTTPDEFYSACEFLFRIRASQPETWREAKYMRETYFDETLGRRVTRTQEIPDEVLKLECLDSIWEMGVWPMSLDMFIDYLVKERVALIEKNREQFDEYFELMNRRSLRRVVQPGQPIPFKFLSEDLVTVLSNPHNPADIVELIQYTPKQRCKSVPKHVPKPKKVASKRPHSMSHSKSRKRPILVSAQGGLIGFEINSVESADPVGSGGARMSS